MLPEVFTCTQYILLKLILGKLYISCMKNVCDEILTKSVLNFCPALYTHNEYEFLFYEI
jgi:hypothetical protein